MLFRRSTGITRIIEMRPAPGVSPPESAIICSNSANTSSAVELFRGNIPTETPANWSISKVVTISNQPSSCSCVPARINKLRRLSIRTNASAGATGASISAISLALMFCSGTMTLLKPPAAEDSKLGTVVRALAAPEIKKRSSGPLIISTLLLRKRDSRMGSNWSLGIGERVRKVISPLTGCSIT